MVLNKSLQVGMMMIHMVDSSVQLIKQQEINVQNMTVELVAQMFTNVQSNVLFHLEGQSMRLRIIMLMLAIHCHMLSFFTNDDNDSHRQPEGAGVISQRVFQRTVVRSTWELECSNIMFIWSSVGEPVAT